MAGSHESAGFNLGLEAASSKKASVQYICTAVWEGFLGIRCYLGFHLVGIATFLHAGS